jgi:excisionase family DNA binding protein
MRVDSGQLLGSPAFDGPGMQAGELSAEIKIVQGVSADYNGGSRRGIVRAIGAGIVRNPMQADLPSRLGAALHAGAPAARRTLSLAEAASVLCVSRRTIYNRIREGRLRTVRTLGGSQRVIVDEYLMDNLERVGDAARSRCGNPR